MKKGWIWRLIFVLAGIALLALPIVIVRIRGFGFTKTQTAIFLSGSTLCFCLACTLQIIEGYKRDKKLNAFLLCGVVVLVLVGVSVWL